LYAANFGRVSALALDPIEKKPLYHFHPGTMILSVGTVGCNLHCQFCQNWQLAQEEVETEEISPANLAALALRLQAKGNIGIAYTYSEPLVWFDYLLETAKRAHRQGLKNVLVTNGFCNPEPLRELLPYLDAVNLDLKGPDLFYQKRCAGHLGPVQNTARLLAGRVHLEVTSLLIPGENDHSEQIKALVRFLAELNPKLPLHFSRYFPHYRLDIPPTSLPTLEEAYILAREELSYVYLGNIGSTKYSSTCCPQCGAVLVERRGEIVVGGIKDGQCVACGEEVDLIL
jgi:pyruvate formate lyase activating enzyme